MDNLLGLPEIYEYCSGPFQGGMGRVYQVRRRDWDERMAVKQPRPEMLGDELVRECYLRECELWISLGLHEHIVPCHYVRQVEGVPTIFAQWMDGGSLHERIASGALYQGTEREVQLRVLDVALQIARGLAYTHSRGMVHRDLKPGNVMFGSDGTARLTDFGLASLFREGREHTRGLGTLAYAPPEQQNGAHCTPQSDLWSFGVMLLELFLGERLWRNSLFVPHGLEEYFGRCRVRVPREAQELIRQCCRTEPLRRPESSGEVEERLLACWRRLDGSDYPRPAPVQGGNVAGLWNNRALSYLDLEKADRALACWDKALHADPGHMASVYNRALFLWRRGNLDDLTALHSLQNAYNAAPSRSSALLLCRFFRERGSAAPIERLNGLFGETLADAGDLSGREQRRSVTSRQVRQMDAAGDRVLLLLRDGSAQLWDLTRSAAPVTLHAPGLHLNWCALDASGEVWAAADEGVVRFSPQGEERSRIAVPEGRVLHLALIGEALLVHAQRREGERCKDYYLRLRLSDGVRRGKIRLEGVESEPFLPLKEGRELLLRVKEQLVRLDLESGRILGRFQAEGPVRRAALSADGSLLAAWDGRTVFIWRTEIGDLFTRFSAPECAALCFARTGSLLLLSGEGGTVQVWECASGRCLRTFTGYRGSLRTLISWERGDAFLGAGVREGVVCQCLPVFGEKALWQLSRAEDAQRLSQDAQVFQRCLRQAADHWKRGEVRPALDCLQSARQVPGYERNGAYLRLNAAMGRKLAIRGVLSAWNRESARQEPSAAGERDPMVSRDRSCVLCADFDGTLRLTRSADGALLRSVHTPLRGVCAVALSPDRQCAALGCQDGRTAVVELETGAVRWQRRWEGSMVSALAFLPRGGFLLCGCGNGPVLLRSGRDGRVLRVLTGHSAAVRSITCSPDALMARTDSEDGQVQIWQFDYEYSLKKGEQT